MSICDRCEVDMSELDSVLCCECREKYIDDAIEKARLEALNDAMVALGTKKVFGGASGGGDTVIVPLGKPTLASKNAQAIIQSLIDKEEL